jgi:hypothetical protein
MSNTNKPTVKLVGTDGNAFAVLGACKKAARLAKWTPEQVQAFTDEAMSGDYNHLLRTCMTHFNVK